MADKKIYKGNRLKNFFIDRYALGLPFDSVAKEFFDLYDMSVSEDEVVEILKDCGEEIKRREEELRSMDQEAFGGLAARLNRLLREIEEVTSDARRDKDYRVFAQLMGPLLKGLEFLAKLTGELHSGGKTQINIVARSVDISTMVDKALVDKAERKKKVLLEYSESGVVEVEEDV